MKVKKSEKAVLPKYPSYRQLSESRALVGLATLGLTAMTGLSDPVDKGVPEARLVGEIAVEPSRSQPVKVNPTAPSLKPDFTTRFKGTPAVEPRRVTPPGAQVVFSAATNRHDSVRYRVKKSDTLSNLAKEYLGNSERWHEITALNPGLTAETLKADSTIQIPAKASKTK